MTAPVRFLIVDDIAENLVALEAILRRDGLEVLPARSAAEALEVLLAHDVALAICDVQMPEVDGFELVEMMRGSPRTQHVPVILVTAALADAQRTFKGYEAGAVDFLFKPLDERVLRSKADIFFDLYRQRQQLRESLELAETFVAVLGHDLRSPLASVVGAAGLLAQYDDPLVRRCVERLRSSSSRMTAMIEQLTDLTRARLGGGLPLAPVPCEVGPVVARVVGEHEGAGATVTLRLLGDTWCEVDPDRLGQVASNLIGNAVRHGGGGRVTVSVDGEGAAVLLSVHNQGAVPDEVRGSLFEPFRKGRERSREGLGLGLYIARQVALAHGGDISFTSTPEAGTTFTLTLPRRVRAQMA